MPIHWVDKGIMAIASKKVCLVGRSRLAQAAEIVVEPFDTLSESNFDYFYTIHQFVKSVGDEVRGFGESSLGAGLLGARLSGASPSALSPEPRVPAP